MNSLASSVLLGLSLIIPLLTLTFTNARTQINRIITVLGFTLMLQITLEQLSCDLCLKLVCVDVLTWSEVIRRIGWSLLFRFSPEPSWSFSFNALGLHTVPIKKHPRYQKFIANETDLNMVMVLSKPKHHGRTLASARALTSSSGLSLLMAFSSMSAVWQHKNQATSSEIQQIHATMKLPLRLYTSRRRSIIKLPLSKINETTTTWGESGNLTTTVNSYPISDRIHGVPATTTLVWSSRSAGIKQEAQRRSGSWQLMKWTWQWWERSLTGSLVRTMKDWKLLRMEAMSNSLQSSLEVPGVWKL